MRPLRVATHARGEVPIVIDSLGELEHLLHDFDVRHKGCPTLLFLGRDPEAEAAIGLGADKAYLCLTSDFGRKVRHSLTRGPIGIDTVWFRCGEHDNEVSSKNLVDTESAISAAICWAEDGSVDRRLDWEAE